MEASQVVNIGQTWAVYFPALALAVACLWVLWQFTTKSLKEHRDDRDKWLASLTQLTDAFRDERAQDKAYQDDMRRGMATAMATASEVLKELVEHRKASEPAAKVIMDAEPHPKRRAN
jgi:hypothetical protein